MTTPSLAFQALRGGRLAALAAVLLGALCMVAASSQAAPATQGVTLCVKQSGARKGTIRFPRVNTTCKSTERSVVLASGTDLALLEALIGKAGEKGPQGERGPEGLQGPIGLQGPEGEQGPIGEEGPEGEEGPQGKQGPEGDKGPTGDKGPEGEQGPAGKEGPQGPEGDKGPTGDKGPEGKEGPEGKQGPEGKEGPQGPSGSAAQGEIRGGGGDSTVEDGMSSRFFGPSVDFFSSTETAIQEVLRSDGTVSDLRVYLTGAPGAGNKYTFTVRNDPAGSGAATSTALSCSVSGNGIGSSACESNGTAEFDAGDAISILATESGSPTTRTFFFRLDYQP